MSKEGSKEVNVDEAVEFYSKKWHVSKEEAAEKIMKLLEARKAPNMEDLFPEPLGELSRKVQDINQAVLNTAFTRRKVADLENPPKPASGVEQSINEAVQDAGKQIITSKLTQQDPIRTKVDEALGELVSDAIKDKLKGSSKEEMRATLDELFDEFGEKVIKPLYEEVQTLKKDKEKGIPMEEAVELIMRSEKQYVDFLEKRGFKVESVSITRDAVEKMIKDEVTKEKAHWEAESGAQVEIETSRIKATENMLTNISDRIMDIFLAPIKDKIQEAIDKGAFRPTGA